VAAEAEGSEASGPRRDIKSTARRQFGGRYGGAWSGGPVVFLAVVDPTPADHEAASKLSYFGRSVVVVPAKYSEAELQAFKDRLDHLLPRTAYPPEPYVFSVGFSVRDGDFTASGQPVVGVTVTGADAEQLVAQIRALVPDDAVQVWVGTPPRRYAP
jgi:hypothetical protein